MCALCGTRVKSQALRAGPLIGFDQENFLRTKSWLHSVIPARRWSWLYVGDMRSSHSLAQKLPQCCEEYHRYLSLQETGRTFVESCYPRKHSEDHQSWADLRKKPRRLREEGPLMGKLRNLENRSLETSKKISARSLISSNLHECRGCKLRLPI